MPGDEAIIPAPYWVSYPDMVQAWPAAEPVIVSAGIEQDFKVTPQQIDAAITDKTRLFVLNSPVNPTGTSYSKAELQALGAVLVRHPKILIVADDIYEHIHWADEPFISFAAACPDLYDRTVTINGVSKAYAMTGWRIGYAAGPRSHSLGDENNSEPEHVQSLQHFTGRQPRRRYWAIKARCTEMTS